MKQEFGRARKYLIISTLASDAAALEALRKELPETLGECHFISTEGKKISHCIGCNDCWIKTPGVCCIKDDYEQILIQILQADCVVFLTETMLGFVCSQMKNLIDRILPLDTMHLHFHEGQMRHDSRYQKAADMALLYLGEADNAYLNLWLDRVQINLHGKTLGAYPFDDRKELYHALSHPERFASRKGTQ